MSDALTGLELRSTVTSGGELRLALVEVTLDEPGADELVVRVEAAPINPSDLGLLFGFATVAALHAGGTAARPTLTAPVPEKALPGLKARLDRLLPVGNEGAGIVIRAGAN